MFKQPVQAGEGTSTAPAVQDTQQAPATTTTAKGKEKMDEQQEVETGQPSTSKDQQSEQAPPQKTEQTQIPVLQTPLNDERGKKRDREEVTPPTGSSQQPEAKRPRIDPETEEGDISE